MPGIHAFAPNNKNLDNVGRSTNCRPPQNGLQIITPRSNVSGLIPLWRKVGEARRGQRTFGGSMADTALARDDRRERSRKAGEFQYKDRAGRAAGDHDRRSRFAHYRADRWLSAGPLIFGACLFTVLAIGWFNRDQEYLIPDEGAGYWLGIVGSALMLLLLLYPLRKRMRFGGSVTFWFRAHMILGLVGPALILFHANFRMLTLNSTVAMIAMLVVAGSGIVGRYLYGKIHLGLYGRKVAVQEILADAKSLKQSLGDNVPGIDHFDNQLDAFAAHLGETRQSLLGGAWRLLMLVLRARVARWRLLSTARQFLRVEAARRGWSRRERARRFAAIVNLVTLYIAAVRKAAAFTFYDRLFSIWHVLHVPLFIILIIAASIHVVAAHFF